MHFEARRLRVHAVAMPSQRGGGGSGDADVGAGWRHQNTASFPGCPQPAVTYVSIQPGKTGLYCTLSRISSFLYNTMHPSKTQSRLSCDSNKFPLLIYCPFSITVHVKISHPRVTSGSKSLEPKWVFGGFPGMARTRKG